MTNNEWGKLKKIVVGIADNAKIPFIDISVRTVNYCNLNDLDMSNIKPGLYPKKVINEANEDLDTLCSFLVSEGIEVVRPIKNNPTYYNYCPRDSVITFKDKSIICPMPLKCRKDEWRGFQEHLKNVIDLSCVHNDNLYDTTAIKNPNKLATKETEPAFDAANIIKANNYLLYLVSNSGNKKGAEKLQEVIGNKAKVVLLENIYSYMHIDSTVAFLREGLILVNPSRIKHKNQLPLPFNKWDVIFAPEPVDIGHYPGYCNSSAWINVNLLSLSENLVVLEEHQTNLAKILNKYNIETKLLPMRHSITLGGCFHCVTLDLIRE